MMIITVKTLAFSSLFLNGVSCRIGMRLRLGYSDSMQSSRQQRPSVVPVDIVPSVIVPRLSTGCDRYGMIADPTKDSLE